MGFFDALCDFASSAFNFVRDIGSSILSGGGLGTTIGGVFSGILNSVVGKLPPVLLPQMSEIQIILQVVSVVANVLAEALGLKQPEQDSPEELGMKAEQAEKKPDDFDSVEAYIQYLHNEIQLDHEKMKEEELTEEQRAAYGAVGSAVYIKGCAEKLDLDSDTGLNPDVLLCCARMGMTAKEGAEITANIMRELSAEGYTSTEPLKNYFSGHGCDLETAGKMQGILAQSIEKAVPGLEKNEIYDRMLDTLHLTKNL